MLESIDTLKGSEQYITFRQKHDDAVNGAFAIQEQIDCIREYAIQYGLTNENGRNVTFLGDDLERMLDEARRTRAIIVRMQREADIMIVDAGIIPPVPEDRIRRLGKNSKRRGEQSRLTTIRTASTSQPRWAARSFSEYCTKERDTTSTSMQRLKIGVSSRQSQ